jgi:predicted O-methyltransferase YrrM
MEFSEAWKIVNPIGTWDALMEDAAKVLWDEVVSLGRNKHLVEIGCHYGRSSALWMLLAKQYGHCLTFIDPWAGPPADSPAAAMPWFSLMRSFKHPFTLHCCMTEEIDPRLYPRDIDFLYVDGEHTSRAVEIDCRMIDQVNPGGIIAFDNYGTHGGVEQVTDALMASGKLIKRSLTKIMLVTQKP